MWYIVSFSVVGRAYEQETTRPLNVVRVALKQFARTGIENVTIKKK